jgi:O-Antigen ligase
MKNRIFYPILLLTGLMPLHNLIVQYATKILRLPEFVVFWKDWIVGFLIIILIIEIYKSIKRIGFKTVIKLDQIRILLPLILIVLLNILAILSSLVFNYFNLRAFVSGYYFELWWLDFFAILITWFNFHLYEVRTKEKIDYLSDVNYADSSKFDDLFTFNSSGLPVAKSKPFDIDILKKQFWIFRNIICIGFLITAAISSASLIFGQENILSNYGYATNSESVGLVGNSLACHTIDYNVPGCRLTGTMSHPIHFAAYLLLVLPVLIVGFISAKNRFSKLSFGLMIATNLYLIFETYSRYALLSLPLLICVLVIYYWRENLSKLKLFISKVILVLCLVLPLLVSLVFVNTKTEDLPTFLPISITKPSSTIWHYRHFMAGIKTLEAFGSKAVTGVGMGQSGSAARTKYQDLQKNTIYNVYGKIAYDWNLTEESFLLVENWYLQTILNNGWIYALIYILITLIPLAGFWKFIFASQSKKELLIEMIFGIGFFAVLVGNQLEHLWENQTIVMFWVLIYFYSKIYYTINSKL